MFMFFLNHDLVFSKTLLVCSTETKYDNYHFLPLLGPGQDSSVGVRMRRGRGDVHHANERCRDTRRAFKENSACSDIIHLQREWPVPQVKGSLCHFRQHFQAHTGPRASDHVAVDWGFPQPPPQTSHGSRCSRLVYGRLAVCQRFSPSPLWVHLTC